MIETNSPLSPRVKTYQTISESIPEFAISENPKFVDFLTQYYISQDYQGGPADIAENIDAYIKIDNLTVDVIRGGTTLTNTISATDDVLTVESTDGYPDKHGLIKIDNEIITYDQKTETSFTGCTRGFSGISSYTAPNNPGNLVWQQTVAAEHLSGAAAQNVSALFLKEFYKKLKAMYAPGLEGVNLSPQLNINNFIKEARSLYESKGTEDSFKILFKALFGIDPKINDLEKYLIKPSYANYVRRKTLSLELISGDPAKLVGETLYQDNDPLNDKFNAASGPISEVSNIRDNYFKLSLFTGFDERSLTDGIFVVPGKTRNIGDIGIGASVLTVDSTIGFSSTGTLSIGATTYTYGQKSINQFFEVSPPVKDTIRNNTDISAPNIVYGFEEGDSSKRVEFKVTGVLNKFLSNEVLTSLDDDSSIRIRNLGRLIDNPEINRGYEEIFFNSWVYNTSTRYEIDSFGGSSFLLTGTIDKSSLRKNDKVDIVNRNSELVAATGLTVASVNTSTNTVTLSGNIPTLDSSLKYDIRRVQFKASSSTVPIKGGQDQLLADINNSYIETENESTTGKREGYVASSSLPSYLINSDKIRSTLIAPTVALGNFDNYNSVEDAYSTLAFTNDVPFRTGDEITYVPSEGTVAISGLEQKNYFVKVLNPANRIELYTSRAFIKAQLPEYFNPIGFGGTHDFILASQGKREIFPSRPIRRFTLEQNLKSGKEAQTTSEVTADGNTGMLVNGLEILNYKGEDQVFYGPLSAINVLSGGTGYDVQNPPNITITDSTVSVANTAGGIVSVAGTVSAVFVDPVDFDIDKVISVQIFGGNGSGARGRALLEERYREISFSGISTLSGGNVEAVNDRFTFGSNHNLVTGNRIVYDSNGNSNLGIATTGGSKDELTLMSGQDYYVRSSGNLSLFLHYSKSDSVLGINTISISEDAASSNSGQHIFRTFEKKKTISRINIEDSGSGYASRKVYVKPVGINTFADSVYFENHGFVDGDIVNYSFETTGITGLSTTKQYKVLRLSDSSFRLAESGNKGDVLPTDTNYDKRIHIFLDSHGSGLQKFEYPEIQCTVKVLTEDQQEQELTATPIVRGEITDVVMYEPGANYGSTIINFLNPPTISVPRGSLGQIGLIFSNGRIITAFVQAGGSGYSGPPNIQVSSASTEANGAVLRAIVNDTGNITEVKVISGGVGYAASTTTVAITPVGNSLRLEAALRPLVINKSYGLDDTELDYLAPFGDGVAVNYIGYGNSIRNFFEDDGSSHSPIIGWAYDGNPIYGPYGLEDPDNIQSDVKRQVTSYNINATNIENRPPISEFPYGSLIDDYVYDGSGDLDEHNGKFTKTPDFPKGVYAYFAAVDNINKPLFPYFIGDTFRSFAIPENTVRGLVIDQTNFDFESSKLVRNTFPYNIFGDGKVYDYVFQPYKTNNQEARPDSLGVGSITSIDVSFRGSGYSVKDKLVFDETGTNGGGVSAEVQQIFGADITKVSSQIVSFSNMPFKVGRERTTFKISPYHEFKENDFVRITGVSTFVSGIEEFHKISVTPYFANLEQDGYSGIVTDLKVNLVPPNVSAGDSIGIGTETMRILNAFPSEKILRVERYAGFATAAVGAAVTYFTSEFSFPLKETTPIDSRFQEFYYFNPKESVGVGTTVGFSTSVNVSLNGVTKTRSIISQSIHIGEHDLKTNDLVTFSRNGNAVINATDSISPYTAPSALGSSLYAVRKTSTTIGLKTSPDGAELFFTNTGDDAANYYFQTNYNQETSDVERGELTVQTTGAHNLSIGDRVNLTVKPGLTTGIGPNEDITVKLLDNNLIINPIDLPTTGVNTVTNTFTISDHGLETGFKVLAYGALGIEDTLPDRLFQRAYFVLKVDNDQFQLSDSRSQLFLDPPEVVNVTGVGSTGQTINPINPPLQITKNNNVVFNLNDPSLLGGKLKIFYDSNYFNEFVGSGTTDNLEVVNVNTVGLGTTVPSDMAKLTLNYNNSFTSEVYYGLEKGGYMSTSDTGVVGYNKIGFVDSAFNGKYNVTGVAGTEFTTTLSVDPEKSNYSVEDCTDLFYTTTSIGATGGISKIRLINNGFGYQKIPAVTSIGNSGISANLLLSGPDINRMDSVTVPTDVYGYPSDNTLKPDAFLPRTVFVKNANRVIDVEVIFGGRSYLNAPSLALYDKSTGEIVQNGLLTCDLSDSAVNTAQVVVQPRGLTGNDYGVAPLQNSNGISIIQAFSDVGVLTCKITTPVLGYVNEPFTVGETVFLEGIQFNGDGDGFNSGDYKFVNFQIDDYNSATNPREVSFKYTGLTTNVGTGATVVPGFGQIVKAGNLAQFSCSKAFSPFSKNEPLRRNDDPSTDLILRSIDTNTGIMVIEGSRPLEADDLLVGTNSGDRAEVDSVTVFDGYYDIDSTIDTAIGWSDNIGLIGDSNQFLPDNDYYQNLSYAIESDKTYEEIITYVNDIVHPAGLKNFANTQILSVGDAGESTKPADDAGGFVLDFISDPLRVDAIYGFDLARDVDSSNNVSKFVELRSTRLADFILNKTNRVLIHDDISPQFVSNESNDLSDDRTIAAAVAGRNFARYLILTSHDAENPLNNQYQFNEVVLVAIEGNTYLLQKSQINNTNNVGLATGYAEFFAFFNANDNITEVRIKPYETFDTNYDIKAFQQGFASDVGIGSVNTGNVVNSSANVTVSAGTTTEITGFSTDTFVAGIGHFVIVDNADNKVDYVELALQHDGTDTYLTELASFNTRQSLGGLSSPTFMGTFTSSIESGVVKINYVHNELIPLSVRSKFVSFENVGLGTTTVRHLNLEFTPEGTERTARVVVGSSATTGISTVVGVTSFTDLAFKSTVHVAFGSTQTLHQVYVMSDPEKGDTFISQQPIAAIGTTTGIGTFGAEFSGTQLNLEFYPDAGVSGMVSIYSYNEVLYKDADPNGTLAGIGSFDYGKVFENVTQNTYLGINNRNLRSFDLKYQGTPIYERNLNPQNPNQLDFGTGLISFKHFFSNTEEVSYNPGSNIVGVAASALQYVTGYGHTSLPGTVFIVKNNNNQFFISTNITDARQGIAVTFQPGTAAGNQHRFTMNKRDEKTVIALNGIVQKPISFTSIIYDLDVAVNGVVTSFALSGLSTVTSGDLLKIEEEYSIVRTVGFATQPSGPITGIGTWSIVEVERGAVGSAATDHSAGTVARIHRGAFQILNSEIHFTEAPLGGDLGIINPANLPYPRASFGGRTYLRNDYRTNELFDDFSDKFDGLENTFPLTATGAAVTGIGSTGGNGVLFINGIFQAPFGENNEGVSNFKILEDPVSTAASVQFSGITSVGFTDLIIDEDDINQNQLPRGGVIVSVASTPGLGYAPFDGAVVKVNVNTAGTITEIVGVSTTGTAVNIIDAAYDNKTGIMTVSLADNHKLVLEDQVKLVGLEFTCPKVPVGTPDGFTYDPSTGISTISFASPHGLVNGDAISIEANSITFTCTQGPGNHTYPRVTDPAFNQYLTISGVTANSFKVNVGTGGTGTSPHTFVSADTDSIKTLNYQGITTTTFPDHNDPFYVVGVTSATTFKVQVGASTIPHTYVSGGTAAEFFPLTFGSGYRTTLGTIGIAITDRAYNHKFVSAGVNSIFDNTGARYTATNARYTSSTGKLVLTLPSHGLTTSNTIGIDTGSLGLSCSKDNYLSVNLYPRSTDPVAGIFTAIASTTVNTVTVNVGPGGGAGTGADVSAVVGVGGSLVFTINSGGSGYRDPDALPPEPNGENLPIVGVSRIGLGATTLTGVGCSIAVQIAGVSTATGIGSTLFEVSDFDFVKKGYGFKRGDKFTVTGLSTDPTAGDDFRQFELEVVDVFTDQVSSWQFGNIDYLDNIKPFQDGNQKRFLLYYQSSLVSFEIDRGDLDSKEIDLSAVLLIFINGVIQEPNINYSFDGGSVIEFNSAPTAEDNVVIFFYRGTIGQDSFLNDINEVIKVGDNLKLRKSAQIELNQVPAETGNLSQSADRIVKRIDSAATVETAFYRGVGISNDNYKPMDWIKQKKDILIDGSLVSKARDSIEAQINPIANVIGVLSTTDAFVYVDNTAMFRDTDDGLTGSFSLAYIAEVGFGTTAVYGINYENITGIEPLVANVQGFIGVVTGISTCPGIGTDLGLLIQFDAAEYVNDGNSTAGLQTGQPIKLYGSGFNTAGVAVTSIDTHDTDIVGITTFNGDNIYYVHSVSTRNGGRVGVLTCNIASYTNTSDFVGVGSTSGPYCNFTWGKFSGLTRDAGNPVFADLKGLNFDPDLTNYPIVQRRGVGLRGTGGLPKLL